MSIREIILQEISIVAADQNKTLPPLTDNLPIAEANMDSLFFAILVSRLEDAIGSDPFATAKASEFPQTIGDLIAFYERVHA